MIDEIKARRSAERAAQAEALLRSGLVTEAFTELKASYVAAWEETTTRDTEAREKLWLATQIVGKVQAHLVTIAANGAIARRDLEELTAKPKRFGIV